MHKFLRLFALILLASCFQSCEKEKTLRQILSGYSYWSVTEDNCIYFRFNPVYQVIEVYEFDSAPTIKGNTILGILSYDIDDVFCYFYDLKGDKLYLDISSPWEDGLIFKEATWTVDESKDLLIIQCDGHEFFEKAVMLKNTHCTIIDSSQEEYLD